MIDFEGGIKHLRELQDLFVVVDCLSGLLINQSKLSARQQLMLLPFVSLLLRSKYPQFVHQYLLILTEFL